MLSSTLQGKVKRAPRSIVVPVSLEVGTAHRLNGKETAQFT